MKQAVMILAFAVCILAVFDAGLYYKGTSDYQRTDKHFAISQRNQTEAIRKILCFADHNIQTSPVRSQADKDAAHDFYNQALGLIHAQPCTRKDRTP